MKDASNFTFGIVERDACPLAVGVHFGALDLQVDRVAGDGCGIIRVTQATRVKLFLQDGLAAKAALFVAAPSCLQPAVKGFYEDEEKEGGEGVSLDGASAYRDARALRVAVCDVGPSFCVDAAHCVDGICWEA